MPVAKFHSFRLTPAFGPEEVFRALKKVTEHDAQRDYKPAFEFDWIARRLVLSANSREGLDEVRAQFMAQMQKAGADKDTFLPGKVMETEDDRFEQPLGVAFMSAAELGELMGRMLVDIGVKGIRIHDQADGCRIQVRQTLFSENFDYKSMITEFPLPGYMTLTDEGIVEAEAPTLATSAKKMAAKRAVNRAMKKKRKKKKK